MSDQHKRIHSSTSELGLLNMSSRSIMMNTRLSLISFGLVGLFACGEPTAPPLLGDLEITNAASASAKRTSSISPTRETTTSTETSTTTSTTPVNALKFASWAKLATYDTSFVVVVGTASKHQINYQATLVPFLRLEIPANADFFGANGLTLKNGTQVSVTVKIDPVYASVQFGPHGTIFKKNPAKVCLNYWGLDLGGRSPQTFAIWYQPDATTSWSAQPTQLDVDYFWLCASLSHFSNYAVAY
jgi:hypothetical protein